MCWLGCDGPQDTSPAVQILCSVPSHLLTRCKHYHRGRPAVYSLQFHRIGRRKCSCGDGNSLVSVFSETNVPFSQDKSCCHFLSWSFFTKWCNCFSSKKYFRADFSITENYNLIFFFRFYELFLHHCDTSERFYLRNNKPYWVTSRSSFSICGNSSCWYIVCSNFLSLQRREKSKYIGILSQNFHFWPSNYQYLNIKSYWHACSLGCRTSLHKILFTVDGDAAICVSVLSVSSTEVRKVLFCFLCLQLKSESRSRFWSDTTDCAVLTICRH